MEFKKIELRDKEIFDKYTYGHINQEASFTNDMMWDSGYLDVSYSIVSDCLVMCFGMIEGLIRYSMPYGDDANILDALGKMYDYCHSEGYEYSLIDCDEKFRRFVEDSGLFHIEFYQDRDYQEYVYSTEKLASLSGKELHSKKNHVNKFRKTYNYRFEPMDASVTDACLKLAKKWLDDKYDGNESEYTAELRSMTTAMTNFDYFGLFGGVMYVDDNIVAFTVGEEMTSDTALIHIEKADTNYKGVYAAINYEFANMLKDKYKYLNREEDMGIEGMRKAKLSYKPEFLTDKYVCKIERR